MLKYFPLSAQAKQSAMHCLVVVVGYCVVAWLVGFIASLLGILPIINIVASLAATLVRLYCAVGAIVAILVFLNVLK